MWAGHVNVNWNILPGRLIRESVGKVCSIYAGKLSFKGQVQVNQKLSNLSLWFHMKKHKLMTYAQGVFYF
jgi:hypothetical protein